MGPLKQPLLSDRRQTNQMDFINCAGDSLACSLAVVSENTALGRIATDASVKKAYFVIAKHNLVVSKQKISQLITALTHLGSKLDSDLNNVA